MAGFNHAVYVAAADSPQRAYPCTAAKCGRDATHVTCYDYATGRRRGRISYAQRAVCREHAQKFAARHGVQVQPAEALPERPGTHIAVLFQAGIRALDGGV